MNKISREQLIKTLITTSFILPGYLGFSILAAAQDGSSGASSYSQPDGVAAASYSAPAPADASIQSNNEGQLLSNTRQLIEGSLRSGEGYFSADGDRFIYQSETVGDNPFYQIYVLNLTDGSSQKVSPGIGLTTCSWIHPTLDMVMFSSTHEDPDARGKQAEEISIRESGISRPYGWDYDRHYDIYQADSNGNNLVNLTSTDGYDAEGSYSADGSQILFASNREAY